jgi:hypothetical protein
VGTSRPARILADPVADLPHQLSLAVVDASISTASSDERARVDLVLTVVFRRALLPYLFENERCGHAAVCGAAPCDPFERPRGDTARPAEG